MICDIIFLVENMPLPKNKNKKKKWEMDLFILSLVVALAGTIAISAANTGLNKLLLNVTNLVKVPSCVTIGGGVKITNLKKETHDLLNRCVGGREFKYTCRSSEAYLRTVEQCAFVPKSNEDNNETSLALNLSVPLVDLSAKGFSILSGLSFANLSETVATKPFFIRLALLDSSSQQVNIKSGDFTNILCSGQSCASQFDNGYIYIQYPAGLSMGEKAILSARLSAAFIGANHVERIIAVLDINPDGTHVYNEAELSNNSWTYLTAVPKL